MMFLVRTWANGSILGDSELVEPEMPHLDVIFLPVSQIDRSGMLS